MNLITNEKSAVDYVSIEDLRKRTYPPNVKRINVKAETRTVVEIVVCVIIFLALIYVVYNVVHLPEVYVNTSGEVVKVMEGDKVVTNPYTIKRILNGRYHKYAVE